MKVTGAAHRGWVMACTSRVQAPVQMESKPKTVKGEILKILNNCLMVGQRNVGDFILVPPAPVRQTDWLAAPPRCQRRGLLVPCPTADPVCSTSDTGSRVTQDLRKQVRSSI